MKHQILTIAILSTLSAASFAGEVERKTVTTTTSTAAPVAVTGAVTSTGTITEYTPGSTFVIKESSGPVHYRYGKTVTYVTRGGQALTEDEVRTRIRVGSPVSVHYVTEGSDRVISRVELGD
jgi:ligand-binding SRPBCC domain-containing protein